MRALVWGGSGSGKSEFAEGLAVAAARRQAALAAGASGSGQGAGEAPACGPLVYIATMAADDLESRRRISRHRRLRAGKGFTTLEKYTHLEDVVLPPGTTVLLECLSNLAANEMFSPDGRKGEAARVIREGLFRLAEQADSLIVVSNDVFGDGTCYPGETEEYRQALAEVNSALAERFSLAVELVHGVPVYWKGGPESIPAPEAGAPFRLERGPEAPEAARCGQGKEETGAMRLVTGGAYQKKLAFAKGLTGKPEPRVWDGAQGEPSDWRQVEVLNHFPELVRRKLAEEPEAARGKSGALEQMLQRMSRENPSLVVVTREVGCGLVPMDAFERLWREQAGRLSCRLAEQSVQVYRVCCGQAQKIKEAGPLPATGNSR